jgi:hypothetical protein
MGWASFSRRVRAALRRGPRPGARIVPSPRGLASELPIREGTSRLFWEWSDIDRAEAFKRDLLATDLICLELRAHGEWVEVNEEMEGWDDLIAQLPQRLPGALSREKLFAAVVKPPFAECRTLAFDRPA